MPAIRVNMRTVVNAASIRREQYNDAEHVVIPSYTLPANVVMNGGLYPAAEIDAHYLKLEGTLAPLGHPVVNGQHVSAFRAEAIHNNDIGAWNRNVKKVGSRVYSEKWINVNVAKRTEGGKRLLDRVAAIERGDADAKPIHTSVAVYVNQLEAPANNDGYSWIANIRDIDHDAILLDEPGAATPEDGVGLMVNTADAKLIAVNNGALEGDSYRDKERRIENAAKDTFAATPDNYVWVADFTDTQAVIIRNGGNAEVFGYKIEAGKVVFDNSAVSVERRETWVIKLNRSLENIKRMLLINAPVDPAKGIEMTPEEKTELATMVANAVGVAVTPLGERLTAIEGTTKAMSDSFVANAKAADDVKRAAVAKVHGQVVADALVGNALNVMFDALPADEAPAAGTAAKLAANSGKPIGATAPDLGGLV